MTTTAEVKVRPVLVSFQANRHATRPGEKIVLTWKTQGASEVLLGEETFGELS